MSTSINRPCRIRPLAPFHFLWSEIVTEMTSPLVTLNDRRSESFSSPLFAFC